MDLRTCKCSRHRFPFLFDSYQQLLDVDFICIPDGRSSIIGNQFPGQETMNNTALGPSLTWHQTLAL